MAWLLSFFKLLGGLVGLGNKVADITKKNQETNQREQDQRQGEQNANAKTTAEGLAAIINADRAAHDPAVDKRVREDFERP